MCSRSQSRALKTPYIVSQEMNLLTLKPLHDISISSAVNLQRKHHLCYHFLVCKEFIYLTIPALAF